MTESSAAVWAAPNLYVHVPFCSHKCEYCAFYSEPSSGAVINRFVSALTREFTLTPDLQPPPTIYFGGGTPSLLNRAQWQTILTTMANLDLLGADEWTVECNPATVSRDKANLWRDYGVNRVSLGVQSLDEALLERLGRVHSRTMVFKTFDLLRQAGFENIGLDLMFAIPGQTLKIWQSTLDEALQLSPEHLSCYEVIYEEDTPLYAQLQANQFSVDEALACDMYDMLLDRSAAAGFEQYEVANFARRQPDSGATAAVVGPPPSVLPAPVLPSLSAGPLPASVPALACRHNLNYWRGGAYHGLGPSAASFLHGVRAKNWPNTEQYCEQLERGQRPIATRDELPPLQRAAEIAAFGLRMTAGWGFAEFQQRTGFDLRQHWQSEINQLVRQEWGIATQDRFRLTRQGLRFADTVAELFLR